MLICDECGKQMVESKPRYLLQFITVDGGADYDICSSKCLQNFRGCGVMIHPSIQPTPKWNDKFDLPWASHITNLFVFGTAHYVSILISGTCLEAERSTTLSILYIN